MKVYLQILVAMVVVGAFSMTANAAHIPSEQRYRVDFTELNDSGVSGWAILDLDGDLLTVDMRIDGYEVGQPHAQHIHGAIDSVTGDPIDSTTPTLAQDSDGDGFIEVAEGAATYGPVIVPLVDSNGDFPTPTSNSLSFIQTYDLSESDAFAADFEKDDLFPLYFREIVLHGQSVGFVGDGTEGEVDGTPGYKGVLPVAAGEIQVVPLPAAVWPGMMLLGGLFAWRTRAAKRDAVAA